MYDLLWYDNIWSKYNYLKSGIWGCKINRNIDKIAFIQMKFLAMHIAN